jgi:hypothetical protein
MKIAINNHLRDVASKYISDMSSSSSGTLDVADSSAAKDLKNQEICDLLNEELQNGFLSTKSYRVLVQFNQSLGLEPFFADFNNVTLEKTKPAVPQEKKVSVLIIFSFVFLFSNYSWKPGDRGANKKETVLEAKAGRTRV